MESLAGELARIAGRYALRDVYVFGSRARAIAERLRDVEGPGNAPRSGPDLDVGVQPLDDVSLSARDRVRLSATLEELFGVPRVDLVVLSEASPLLSVEVVKGELLYSADHLAQAEQELYVLRRAADLVPLQRARTALILEEGGR